MHARLRADPIYEPAGLLWTWWRGDPTPVLPPLPDLTVDDTASDSAVSRVAGIELDDVRARKRQGHRPYLAQLQGVAVGYGWSVSGQATFGRPPVPFAVPAGARYLRDFATLPAWRGLGVYSHLLQAILSREASDADQFWILHYWGNHASARGIVKAGFMQVGTICFLPAGGLGLLPSGPADRAEVGAELLGLSISTVGSIAEQL